MALGAPIQLRLSEEKKAQYEDEAASRGMGLVPYLRQRLEQGDAIAEQLAELRTLIADGFDRLESARTGAPATGSGAIDPGMMIEMLLLLRAVVGEGKLGVVHGELRRQGLPVWTGGRSAVSAA
jgi:hypothetical protein